MSLEQVAGLSRRDGAVQEIRRAIVKGALRPGEKVTEVGLAAQLGISRPTLREALNQLAREGLLVQEPYRGMRVAELSLSAHLDLARTREALDLLAVDAILADETGGRMAALDAHWQRFAAVETHPDPLLRHEAHVAFHRAIWEASENEVLVRVWPVIEAHITVALAQDQAIRSDPARASTQHHALVDALHSGDRSAIERAIHEHTISSAEELVAILDRSAVAASPRAATRA
ncbi:GntR family transcriptional regulator [Microbacterium sp. 1.5R]|uniref:GntR family transcriptional regulator n=1 Tax=Microbacterium sp. 1.5R TaxID=1916917 RepID=UPI0021B3939F|nr:GntR family transcriptional regulator [Microbacterium sp. 1.5R]